jgi:hypothetical protein
MAWRGFYRGAVRSTGRGHAAMEATRQSRGCGGPAPTDGRRPDRQQPSRGAQRRRACGHGRHRNKEESGR